MLFNTVVRSIEVAGKRVTFQLQEQTPCCEIQGHLYTSLQELLADHPIEEARALAEVVTFFCEGLSAVLLTKPSEWNVEALCVGYGAVTAAEIAPPKIVGDTLVFFVLNRNTALPYRVTMPYPYAPSGKISFATLIR